MTPEKLAERGQYVFHWVLTNIPFFQGFGLGEPKRNFGINVWYLYKVIKKILHTTL